MHFFETLYKGPLRMKYDILGSFGKIQSFGWIFLLKNIQEEKKCFEASHIRL